MDVLRWLLRAVTVALVGGPLLWAYATTPWELACLAAAGVLQVEAGLQLWRSRSDSRLGPLLAVSGLLWLLNAWGSVALPAWCAGGLLLSILYDPMLLHASLVVVSGRLRGGRARAVAAMGYGYWPTIALGLTVVGTVSAQNLLQVRAVTYPVVGVVLTGFFVLSYRKAAPADRRAFAPFWAAIAVNGVSTTALSTITYQPDPWPVVLHAIGAALIPAGALASRYRLQRRDLIEARDNERRRVERDVHDGVQQRLIVASMMLRQNDPALVAQGAAEVENAIIDLRDLVRGMNPSALVRYGLGGAVAQLAERARVRVAVDDRVSDLTLPEPVAATAYYVAMEAVANCEKHGRAGLVTVTLAAAHDRVEVTVRDDGVGGAQSVAGGGLAGLRERVESCGGILRLESSPGRGTAVQAVLPIGAP